MRAALFDRFGPAHDVLRVGEIETPHPGPGEVRVKVAFSAVNPTDWKTREQAQGRTMAYPFQVPNQDGSGVIDEVGSGVDPERVGERVWLYFTAYQRQFGSAAEYVCVAEQLAVPLANDASLELGAMLGVPALTAHHALFADGSLEGKTVLVAGGAGAVGHFAIELARWRGARVITTVSSEEKAELAKAAGADVIVNYRAGKPAEEIRNAAPQGVQRIIEVAPENFSLDLEVIAPLGTIVFYASTDASPQLPVRALMTSNLTLRFMQLYTIGQDRLELGIAEVNEAIRAGALSELPTVRFSLEEIAKAHRAVEEHALGKVLIEL